MINDEGLLSRSGEGNGQTAGSQSNTVLAATSSASSSSSFTTSNHTVTCMCERFVFGTETCLPIYPLTQAGQMLFRRDTSWLEPRHTGEVRSGNTVEESDYYYYSLYLQSTVIYTCKISRENKITLGQRENTTFLTYTGVELS